VIFAWGGIYYAIYSLALIKLGGEYSGADLVAGNAACSAMWGIGGIVGTRSPVSRWNLSDRQLPRIDGGGLHDTFTRIVNSVEAWC